MRTRQDRHERDRAAWLLDHEPGWHLGYRRTADLLKSRALKRERDAAGAKEGLTHESHLRPLYERFWQRGEDAGERMARMAVIAIVAVVLAVVVGAAWVASWVLYGLYTTVQLAFFHRKAFAGKASLLNALRHPPRHWGWLVLTAPALASAGYALWTAGAWPLVEVTPWPLSVVVHWRDAIEVWGWLQLALVPLLTAWNVRRRGWHGVKRERKAELSKDLAAINEVDESWRDELPQEPAAATEPTPAAVADVHETSWLDDTQEDIDWFAGAESSTDAVPDEEVPEVDESFDALPEDLPEGNALPEDFPETDDYLDEATTDPERTPA